MRSTLTVPRIVVISMCVLILVLIKGVLRLAVAVKLPLAFTLMLCVPVLRILAWSNYTSVSFIDA